MACREDKSGREGEDPEYAQYNHCSYQDVCSRYNPSSSKCNKYSGNCVIRSTMEKHSIDGNVNTGIAEVLLEEDIGLVERLRTRTIKLASSVGRSLRRQDRFEDIDTRGYRQQYKRQRLLLSTPSFDMPCIVD